jgi:hypothetical protein
MMRLRVLIMIEFLDNDWSHQINSIKMIHRQIKMCEWFKHVLYRRTDHMTSFEYNSSRIVIIFANVLSLIHDFRTLSIMGSHISWHISRTHNNKNIKKRHRVHLKFELIKDSTLLKLIYSILLLILTIERLRRCATLFNTSILTEFSHKNVETWNNQIEYKKCKRITAIRK